MLFVYHKPYSEIGVICTNLAIERGPQNICRCLKSHPKSPNLSTAPADLRDGSAERSRHFLTWAVDGKSTPPKNSFYHPQFHGRVEISLQNTTTKDFRKWSNFFWPFSTLEDFSSVRIHPGIQWLIPQFSDRKRTHFKSGGQNPQLSDMFRHFHIQTRHFPPQKRHRKLLNSPMCGHAAGEAGEAGEAAPCGTSGTRRRFLSISPMDPMGKPGNVALC